MRIIGDGTRHRETALRGQGRFPVFATCPVVILAHSQTIADQGEKQDRLCEVHSSRRTSSTASSPWPFEDSLRGLATKTRMGRQVGAWCRSCSSLSVKGFPSLRSSRITTRTSNQRTFAHASSMPLTWWLLRTSARQPRHEVPDPHCGWRVEPQETTLDDPEGSIVAECCSFLVLSAP